MEKTYKIEVYNQLTDKCIISTAVSLEVFEKIVTAARDENSCWFTDLNKNVYSSNFKNMYLKAHEE